MTDLATRLAKHCTVDPETGCHNWTGGTNRQGYGRMKGGPRTLSPHRVAYELANGPIPDGLQIDHLCRNRLCANPAHLEAVTPQENMRRAVGGIHKVNGAKTHCPRGHELSGDNLDAYQLRLGKRTCRECKRINMIAYRSQKGSSHVPA